MSHPHRLPILQSFSNMLNGDVIRVRQIRDGTGDFDGAVVAAGGELHPLRGLAKKCRALHIKRTKFLQIANTHFLVG